MTKLLARMREAVLMKRSLMVGMSFVLAALAMGAGLIDHTTWTAILDFLVAGFLLSNGIHALHMPGVMTVWHEIERQNIKEQLEQSIGQIIQQHQDADDDAEHKRGLN